MRKVWPLLILIAIIGLGMAVTGYIFGASMSISFNIEKKELFIDGVSTEASKEKLIDEADTENFIALDIDYITDIDIDVLTPIVEIIPSDKYKLEISYREEAPISYTINNGRLKINQEAIINIINFNLSSFQDYINIYVPYDTVLDNVNIDISSGKVIINDLSCSSLGLKLSSGKVTVQDVYADVISLTCTSGNVSFQNCEADSFDSQITSGSFKAYKIKTSNNFNLNMTSGNAVIEGELLGKNNIKLTSGDADITINGREDDYNRSVGTTSGKVYVNGNKNDSNYNNKNALNNLYIKCTSGNVSISFTE